MDLRTIEWSLSIALVSAETLLVLRLVREGLVRRYPFFSSYWIAEIVFGLLLIQIDVRSDRYIQVFRIYSYVVLLLRVGLAAELYERICEHFTGIGTFRFRLAPVLVLIAGIVALVDYTPDLGPQWRFCQTFVIVCKRYQSEIFAVGFLLMALYFRFWLQVRPSFRRNVLNHWKLSTVYFTISGAASLAVLWIGVNGQVHVVSIPMMAADILCIMLWAKYLGSAGERYTPIVLDPEFLRAREELIEQLLEDLKRIRRQRREVVNRFRG